MPASTAETQVQAEAESDPETGSPDGSGAAKGSDAAASGKPGRPGRQILAAAAMAGVILLAAPLLLLAGNDESSKHSDKTSVPPGTVLGGAELGDGVGAYETESPSSPRDPSVRPTPLKNVGSKAELVSSGSSVVPGGKKPAGGTNAGTKASSGATSKPATSGSVGQASKKTKYVATSNATTTVVRATRVLNANQSWKATKATMVMRADGNLVVYDENGTARWSSKVFGQGNHAVFQADGNLVVYNGSGKPVWQTRSGGHDGAILVLQNDGNVTISKNSVLLWASNTDH